MYGYAVMKLLPDQFKSLEINDFVEMYVAYKNLENKEFDEKMTQLAWQTSLIMNSSGRYKKGLKPSDLYKPFSVGTVNTKVEEKSIEELREELKASFSL